MTTISVINDTIKKLSESVQAISTIHAEISACLSLLHPVSKHTEFSHIDQTRGQLVDLQKTHHLAYSSLIKLEPILENVRKIISNSSTELGATRTRSLSAKLEKLCAQFKKREDVYLSLESKIDRFKSGISQKEIFIVKQRREIPSSFDSDAQHTTFVPIGFELDSNVSQQHLLDAIQANSFHKVFDELGDLFKCDPLQICLVDQRNTTRGGMKCNAIYLRYKYNEDFNDFLMNSTESRRFDGRISSWHILNNANDVQTVLREVANYFTIILDMDTGIAYRSNNSPIHASTTDILFAPASESFELLASDIEAQFPVNNLNYIHNGTEFVPLSQLTVLSTKFRCLLVRTCGRDQNAKLALLHLKDGTIQPYSAHYSNGIPYLNQDAMLLARFIDTCHATGVPGFMADL